MAHLSRSTRPLSAFILVVALASLGACGSNNEPATNSDTGMVPDGSTDPDTGTDEEDMGTGDQGMDEADTGTDEDANMDVDMGPDKIVQTVMLPGDVPLRFVELAAGTFEMGCKEGRDDLDVASCTSAQDGAGLHDVTLTRDMWIAEVETTQAQWATLATGNADPSGFDGADNPVEQVSWNDAAWFANALSAAEGLTACYDCTGGFADGDTEEPTCDSIAGGPYDCTGYRLPTEAEWEYAARGNEDLQYAGSADVAEVAWYQLNNNPSGTKAVGTLQPNGFGLYDMNGNVREWVGDWHDAPYATDPVTDPIGPTNGTLRVSRNGDFSSAPITQIIAHRDERGPTIRRDTTGFRLARTAP